MTQNTKQTGHNTISYATAAESFSGKAKSLIPDSTIDEILAEEKILFEHADALQISPIRIVGSNTLRYCKDLLRRKQPFPFLYSALCFLTEVSILMLLYGIAMGIYGELSAERDGFFASFSFLYELILFTGVVSFNTLTKSQFRKILAIPFSGTMPSGEEARNLKNALKRSRLISLAAILFFMALAAVLVHFFDLYRLCQIKVYFCFFAYVACMVLLGIHNVIYDSHLISFLTIGSLLITRRPSEEINAAADQYLNLSYTQLLSQSHKKLEDCIKNPELAEKLRISIHSRIITGRIYYILAVAILLVLDIICAGQMRHAVTPTLLIFYAISILLTLLLIVAVVAANHIIRLTKQQKEP